MATVKEIVLPHHKKGDGTWNIKIRVTHNRKSAYIDTEHFIGLKQLKKDFTIKDSFILDLLAPKLKEYRTKISELGSTLSFYDAKALATFLSTGGTKKAEEINVIEFGRKHVERLKALNRGASAANLVTVINSLVDYFRSEFVPITSIRLKILLDYEQYLRSERRITRLNQFGHPVTKTAKGLSDSGLHNHMRDLRILFNEIRAFYNDEDMEVVIVKHYPFAKYKLVSVTPTEKKKLTVKQLKAIRDCQVPPGSRAELAKDLFMLSFYLCGMNAVDIWKLPSLESPIARVNYNRSKTQSRRRDRAYISVNIPPVAACAHEKYAGKLPQRYSTHITLDQALSKGIQAIGKLVGIPDLEFYDARHAFADLARNKCRFSKDDVGLALNHKDQTNAVTDIYLSKNWDIIDEVQNKVVALLQTLRTPADKSK